MTASAAAVIQTSLKWCGDTGGVMSRSGVRIAQLCGDGVLVKNLKTGVEFKHSADTTGATLLWAYGNREQQVATATSLPTLLSLSGTTSRSGSPTAAQLELEETETVVLVKDRIVTCFGSSDITFPLPIDGDISSKIVCHSNTIVCLHLEQPLVLVPFITLFGNREPGSIDHVLSLPLPKVLETSDCTIHSWDLSPRNTTVAAVVNDFFMLWKYEILCCVIKLDLVDPSNVQVRCSNLDTVVCGGGIKPFKVGDRDTDIIARREIKKRQQDAHLVTNNDESDAESPSLIRSGSYKSVASTTVTNAVSVRSGHTMASETFSRGLSMSSSHVNGLSSSLLATDPMELSASAALDASLNLNAKIHHSPGPASSICERNELLYKKLLRVKKKKKSTPIPQDAITDPTLNGDCAIFIDVEIIDKIRSVHLTCDCLAIVTSSSVFVSALGTNDEFWYKESFTNFSVIECCHSGVTKQGVPVLICSKSCLYLVTPYHNTSELLSNTLILQSVSNLSSPVDDCGNLPIEALRAIYSDWVKKSISLRDINSLRQALASASKELPPEDQFEILSTGLTLLAKGDRVFMSVALKEIVIIATDVIRKYDNPQCVYQVRALQAELCETDIESKTPSHTSASAYNTPIMAMLSTPEALSIPSQLRCFASESVDQFLDTCVSTVLIHGVSTLVIILNSRDTLQQDFLQSLIQTASSGGYPIDTLDLSARGVKCKFTPEFVCSAMSVVASEILLKGDYEKGVLLMKKICPTHGDNSWFNCIRKLVVETVDPELRNVFCNEPGLCSQVIFTEADRSTLGFITYINKLLRRFSDSKSVGLSKSIVYPASFNPVPASFHPDTLHQQKSISDHNFPYEVESGTITDFGITYKHTLRGSSQTDTELESAKQSGLALSWLSGWTESLRTTIKLDCLFLKTPIEESALSILDEIVTTEAAYQTACDWCIRHSNAVVLSTIINRYSSKYGTSECCSNTEIPIAVRRVLNVHGASLPQNTFTSVTEGFKIMCEKSLLHSINSDTSLGPGTLEHLVKQPLPAISATSGDTIWERILSERPEGVSTKALLYAHSRCGGSKYQIALLAEAVTLGLDPNPDLSMPPVTLDSIFAASPNPLAGLVVLSYCEHSLAECLSAGPEVSHHLLEATLLHSLRGSPALLAAMFPEAAVGMCGNIAFRCDDTTGADSTAGTLDISTSENDTSLYTAIKLAYSKTLHLSQVLRQADAKEMSTAAEEVSLTDEDRSCDMALASDVVFPELIQPAIHSLNISYYLTKYRPIEAFQHVLVEHGMDSCDYDPNKTVLYPNQIPDRVVKQYEIDACSVALSNCHDDMLASAVVVFLNKIGTPDASKKLAISILSVRRILKYSVKGEGLTEEDVLGYFKTLTEDEKNTDNKERVLNLLEAATALMESIGETEDDEGIIVCNHDFESALSMAEEHIDKFHRRKVRSSLGLPKQPVTPWWLVTSFSDVFGLPRYTSHLLTYIGSGDWSSLLSEAQYLNMSPDEVTDLLSSAQTKYTGARKHLLIALRDGYTNPSGGIEEPSSNPSGTSLFFESLLAATGMTPEKGSEHLLKKAVEHRLPVLAVYAPVLCENTSGQKCLLAWLCCIEESITGNSVSYPSHENEKQAAADVSARIINITSPHSDGTTHILSVIRGIEIFLPSSALLFCIMIAHATFQRRWTHIKQAVTSMQETHKMPWEKETCDTVLNNLIKTSPPHIALSLLTQLEQVGGPYVYHVCTSVIVKKTLKALPGDEGPSWILKCGSAQDAILILCKLGLFDEAKAVAGSVGRGTLEIDLSQVTYFIINNLMHCPVLVHSSAGLQSMLLNAAKITSLDNDHSLASVLGSCMLLVRYFLRDSCSVQQKPIEDHSEADTPTIAAASAVALVTGLISFRLNVSSSFDLMVSTLSAVKSHTADEDTTKHLHQLAVSFRGNIMTSVYSVTDKLSSLCEAFGFMISLLVECLDGEIIAKVNKMLNQLFPRMTLRRDSLVVIKMLSVEGQSILSDAVGHSGIPNTILRLDKSPKTSPILVKQSHTDEELIEIARRFSRCSSTAEAFSQLPSNIVGKLVTSGAVDSIDMIRSGDHYEGSLAVIRGLASLTTTTKGTRECTKLCTLVGAAKHTETNTEYLSRMQPCQLLKLCLKWTETVERGWSWHAGIELGKDIVSAFDIGRDDVATAITQLLIENCYKELATSSVLSDKSTVMISDYMTVPQHDDGDDNSQTDTDYSPIRGTNTSDMLYAKTTAAFDESLTTDEAIDHSNVTQQFKTKHPHPLSRRDSVGGSFSGLPQAAYGVGIQWAHLLEMASLCGSAGEATLASVILKEIKKIKDKLCLIHKQYKSYTSTKWVRSVILHPYIAALVHASWLCEYDYDQTLIADIKQLLLAAVDECSTLNELSAVAPLLMCFPDLKFINHVVPLLVSREHVDSIQAVFQSAPHAWGESQCLLYSYMQRKSETCPRTRDVFCKMLASLGMHNEVADALECQGHMKVKEALDSHMASYRPQKKKSRRLGKSRHGGDDVTVILRQQGVYLSRAALFFQEASVQYLKAKSCASARRCLNLADLVGLQERHPISELRVVGISTTGARSVLGDLKSFKDALIVANCYDINTVSEWLYAIYNQVIVNHSRVYWEEYAANMPYHPVLFKEIVQLYKNEKHSKKQVDMLRFLLQDCHDKKFAEEALKKKNLMLE
eukprot:TRINITY_DN5939_c4_g1_i1.p1 TRINITY_DN5939_c4_g1~~TRINITY_DN5939_c4_g1_i1.p1  ORF type:complete len:2680 (+),score=431.46 TRINITY_DN5939_c4_g1_i1:41-8080(+)